MASDVKNTSNGTTGTMNSGRVVVLSSYKTVQTLNHRGFETRNIADIDEYEGRLDDVRYYTGDAST